MDDDPDSAVPPRWMFWDSKALDEWFEERKDRKANEPPEMGMGDKKAPGQLRGK